MLKYMNEISYTPTFIIEPVLYTSSKEWRGSNLSGILIDNVVGV